MKKKEVEVGGHYWIQVSEEMTVVRIVSGHARGWHAVNVRTSRSIVLRSAQRLRCPASEEAVEAMMQAASDRRARRGVDHTRCYDAWAADDRRFAGPRPKPMHQPFPQTIHEGVERWGHCSQ